VENWIAILGRVVLAFLLAVAGGALSAMVGVSHHRLCGLISLAAGTLLGVTLFTILPETVAAMSWWQLLLAFASGYAVFFLISKYVFHVCPACAASHFDEATTHRFSEIASALIIALAVHSTLDGLALAAGHEAQGRTDATMMLAVCVHKVPEGLALGALLLGAGFKRAKAVAWVAAVEATTILGGVAGILWLRPGFWLDAVLAHAGGGFVFLAAHAVLGEMVKHGKTIVLANFAIGVVLIAVLNLAVRLL
jgi:zinc transporter, ZIP family